MLGNKSVYVLFTFIFLISNFFHSAGKPKVVSKSKKKVKEGVKKTTSYIKKPFVSPKGKVSAKLKKIESEVTKIYPVKSKEKEEPIKEESIKREKAKTATKIEKIEKTKKNFTNLFDEINKLNPHNYMDAKKIFTILADAAGVAKGKDIKNKYKKAQTYFHPDKNKEDMKEIANEITKKLIEVRNKIESVEANPWSYLKEKRIEIKGYKREMSKIKKSGKSVSSEISRLKALKEYEQNRKRKLNKEIDDLLAEQSNFKRVYDESAYRSQKRNLEKRLSKIEKSLNKKIERLNAVSTKIEKVEDAIKTGENLLKKNDTFIDDQNENIKKLKKEEEEIIKDFSVIDKKTLAKELFSGLGSLGVAGGMGLAATGAGVGGGGLVIMESEFGPGTDPLNLSN